MSEPDVMFLSEPYRMPTPERVKREAYTCRACGKDLSPTPEQIEALHRFGNPLRREPCLRTEDGLHRVDDAQLGAADKRDKALPTPYYRDELVTLYCADNADVLPGLSDIDLVFTSPPYNLGVSAGGGFGHYSDEAGLRQRGGGGKWTGGALAHGYTDHDDKMSMADYEAWQRDVLRACWETLNERGAIFYNHKPRVQAQTLWLPLVLNPGLPVRQIIVWARAGGGNFAPTHYLPTHEWIVVLAKSAWRLKSKEASGIGDVWYVPQEANTSHPAPFPLGLPARAIESTEPSLVLDPFAGSGTTLRAAKDAGVKAIGVEKSERYCEIAVRRLAQESLFAAPVSSSGGPTGDEK